MASVFLLLNQNSLLLFTKAGQPPSLVFPKTVVNHQEIIDRKAFETLLQEFFAHYPKLEAILFLSNDIIFEKTIQLSEAVILDDEMKKFVESVPFPSAQVETRVIQTKTSAYLYGVNSDLYKTIVGVAQQNGWKIANVLPLSIYAQMLQGKEISYASLSQIFKQKTHLKEIDFLHIIDNKPKKSLPGKQLLLLFVCLIFLGTAIWFALDNLGLLPKSATNPASVAPSVVSPAAHQSLAPSPSNAVVSPTVKKETIAIQIFNGSGVAGQATKVKNQLTAIGFTNIQTGNTSVSTSSATTVVFSDNVASAWQNEILTELKTTFTNVVTDKKQLPAGFDVSITTGKE